MKMFKPKLKMLDQSRRTLTVSGTKRDRGSRWGKTRQRIFVRDNFMCQCANCCGRLYLADEVDHILPLHKGGTDADDNLQAINRECHKKKTVEDLRQV